MNWLSADRVVVTHIDRPGIEGPVRLSRSVSQPRADRGPSSGINAGAAGLEVKVPFWPGGESRILVDVAVT